jgi:GntR family transcriptional repressor for pyruvate dehydrogenase complex
MVALAADFSPKTFLLELIELRMTLEPTMASLAAERATEEEILEMEKAVIDLKTNTDSHEQADYADVRLHLSIAKATHNKTFYKLSEPVLCMLNQYRERLKHIPGRRKNLVAEHEAVFSAIKNRNPKKAEETMRYHISQVRKMLDYIEKDDLGE